MACPTSLCTNAEMPVIAVHVKHKVAATQPVIPEFIKIAMNMYSEINNVSTTDMSGCKAAIILQICEKLTHLPWLN